MKIQITLTTAELKSIVARHLNLPNGLNVDDIAVTISTDVGGSNVSYWYPLKCWNDVVKQFPERKIEAIKAVRTEYNLGLAEAKHAIEAPWSVVKAYLEKNGGSLNGFRWV